METGTAQPTSTEYHRTLRAWHRPDQRVSRFVTGVLP